MADFVRPAVRAAVWHWREAIFGGAVAALGLWWVLTFYSPVQWLGWIIVALGAALALGGWQRARFRRDGAGPGVVQVTERRLTYFGPLTGGGIDMEDVTALELEPAALPAPHWVLSGQGGQRLEIPVNAKGADALFDLFAALPGIETEAMLSTLSHTPKQRVTIWTRPQARLS